MRSAHEITGRGAASLAWLAAAVALALAVIVCPDARAFTLSVVDPGGNPVYGFRYLIEEDTTNVVVPGALVSDSIGVTIHKSYAPVSFKGNSLGSTAAVDVPPAKRYFVSVLPLKDYAISGTTVAPGQASVRVIVQKQRIPTAQFKVLVFEDNHSINNAPDTILGTEHGLPNFDIIFSDQAGQVSVDAFGNMLGTTYETDGSGKPVFDDEGNPIVLMEGTGIIKTDANGDALVKYLAPGKYGVRAVPPLGQGWVQTNTIEGTPVIDAWVKANEPPFFVEGFEAAFDHVFFGFVRPASLPWAVSPPAGTGTITGRLVNNHFSRPPLLQGFWPGQPVKEGWVALNSNGGQGLIAVPCDENGEFVIENVPAGEYQLVTWDTPLITIFGFHLVSMADGQALDMGDLLTFYWFGMLEGTVFHDGDRDGFRDPGEPGLADVPLNIRFRDGSIYQSTTSKPPNGDYSFDVIFPFFKWLVAEVGFGRLDATGMTAVVDNGGEIPPHDGWVMPSFGKLTPQKQAAINPNTGNDLSRTETGVALLEGIHSFAGQTNWVDWGKAEYGPGGNGGITGVIGYSTTRAENDPRYSVIEPWEPGIARVQMNLYRDANRDGAIDDLDGDGSIRRADVDNHPFGWSEGGAKGPEDVDWNYPGQTPGVFDIGDALEFVTSDSWDDNMPEGSIYDNPIIVHGQPAQNGFDNFATWNQVRPAVFDGGYAFNDVAQGMYIVEVAPPPGYEVVKEEDKNVDFGDSYSPKRSAQPIPEMPPLCVGEMHTVPDQYSLFAGTPEFAGQTRPLCNRKQVLVEDGKNAAADFNLFTEVPKAARTVGIITDDLAAEFDPFSPIYGEKSGPSWIPVAFLDWEGNELFRVYADEWGSYNALLPSTYSVNIPCPTGVSPQMLRVLLNSPLKPNPATGLLELDPFFDPGYSVAGFTFDFWPGKLTYLDTPVVPVSAFVGYPNRILDVEPPDMTPVVLAVNGPLGGPVVCNAGDTVTITSPGTVAVPNPDFDPDVPGSPLTVDRDFGFAAQGASSSVTVGGTPLNITTWTNTSITATVPGGATTGQLVVTRNDNLRPTEIAVTLHVLSAAQCANVLRRVPAQYATIQAAIDASNDGDLIVVSPGAYNENLIMYKKVRLQGSGERSTIINAYPSAPEKLTAWNAKIQGILGLPPDTEEFITKEAPGIMLLGNAGHVFDAATPALIDGFTVLGALTGGGVYVNSDVHYLTVSNNRIMNNQGTFGGGVTIGEPNVASNNTNVTVRDNWIVKNGGIRGSGGVGIYNGSDNYLIQRNRISGNFSRFSGAGIGHIGLSNPGTIAFNRITFNEVSFGATQAAAGDGGGVYIAGEPAATGLTPGAGSVTVNANLIQGNLSGAGRGGGILAESVNGADVEAAPGTPASWHTILLANNIIANNVAGWAGGGIYLQDCARAFIVNDTIAANDSTSTAANAFPPGNLLQSAPRGAGIVSNAHTAELAAIPGFGQTYSDPVLEDCILWHNRSFSWDGTVGTAGALVPPAATPNYLDLEVTGLPAPQILNPQYCRLTSTAGYAATNSQAAPGFLLEYANVLLTAALVEEGGNAVTVKFTPLKESSGNYHIGAAINTGNGTYLGTFAELATDYDGAARAVPVDSGADQF